jgi:hypothetical protein
MAHATPEPRPTMLYRLYNAAGELIYVGITEKFGGRFTQHEHSPWWPEVDRVETQRYPTRLDAQGAEIALIQSQLPKYNDCNIANAERARRGLPHRAPPKREPRPRLTARRKAELVGRHLRTPCGYTVLDDGRIDIHCEDGGNWTMSAEKAWLRYGPREGRQLPDVVIEHDEPPVQVIGGWVIGCDMDWPVETYRSRTDRGDGTVWETRLEPDGKWRTRIVWS